MPDDDALAPEVFDEVYTHIAAAQRTNELFNQVLGP